MLRMISVDAANADVILNGGDPDESYANMLDGGLFGAFAHSGIVIANDLVWEYAVDEFAHTRVYRYALAEVVDHSYIKELRKHVQSV